MDIDKKIEELYNNMALDAAESHNLPGYYLNEMKKLFAKQRDEIYKDISEDLVAMANEYSIMEKGNSPYIPYSKVIRLINKIKALDK